MKSLRMVVLILLLPPLVDADNPSVDDLAWLSGCWELVGQEQGSGEQWMPPAGRSMLGMNRVVRDDRMVSYEFIRIVEEEDDTVVFIASPSGQETTRFALVRMEAHMVVFENAEHDFPQRVIYRLLDNGDLHGQIEGMINGKIRRVDFPMKKTACGEAGTTG